MHRGGGLTGAGGRGGDPRSYPRSYAPHLLNASYFFVPTNTHTRTPSPPRRAFGTRAYLNAVRTTFTEISEAPLRCRVAAASQLRGGALLL